MEESHFGAKRHYCRRQSQTLRDEDEITSPNEAHGFRSDLFDLKAQKLPDINQYLHLHLSILKNIDVKKNNML